MNRIIRFSIILGALAFAIYCIFLVFNVQGTIFTTEIRNGITYIKFDIYKWLTNFDGSFDKFTELISEIGGNHYNWSDFISAIKSLCNVVISLLNTVLVPFSLIGSLLNIICAFLGLPLNDTNPLFTIFNGIAGMQIPYIPVD